MNRNWRQFYVGFMAGVASVGIAGEGGQPANSSAAVSHMPRLIRVAGAQLPVVNDVQKNLAAITRAIEFATREKADVLVTP